MNSNIVGNVKGVAVNLDDLKALAYHEASHAICAKELWIPFKAVSMFPNDCRLHVTTPVSWRKRWEWLTVYCAGAGGNVLWGGLEWPESWDRYGSVDLDSIWTIFRPYLHDDVEFGHLVLAGQKRALELLRQHERDVQVIAEHLLEEGGLLTRKIVDVRLDLARRVAWLDELE